MARAPKQTKRERFLNVAVRRTQKVLDAIDSLRNCTRTDIYEFSPEDGEKICDAIQKDLDKLRDEFAGKSQTTFRLEP